MGMCIQIFIFFQQDDHETAILIGQLMTRIIEFYLKYEDDKYSQLLYDILVINENMTKIFNLCRNRNE